MGFPTDKRSAYRSKGEIAYEALKEGILSGALEPGQRLALNRIAEDLGISEIPVREAVKRLEAEGLIARDQSAFLVARLSRADLEESYVIRAALELVAVRTAVPRVTPEVMAQLGALVEKMQGCVDQGHYQDYGALNAEFHSLLYAQSPFPNLQRLIADFWSKAQRARIVFALNETAAKSNQEHRELLRCLAQQDVEGAVEVIRVHTDRTYQTLKALLDSGDESPEQSQTRKG